MRRIAPALAALLVSAVLQVIIFPVAGPLPFWRAQVAWLALVPWLIVIFRVASGRRPMATAALLSWLCGVLWYAGHCYWVFQTMHLYGGLSFGMSALVLFLFCLYLGLYHALFGALAAWFYRRFSSLPAVLCALLLSCAWVTVELARARVTSFPWDLLGYSQTENAALLQLTPWTGIYGPGFLLILTNIGIALTIHRRLWRVQQLSRKSSAHSMPWLAVAVIASSLIAANLYRPPLPTATHQAIAVQPNLEPLADNAASQTPLEDALAALTLTASRQNRMLPNAVALWPEAPASFELHDPRLRGVLMALSQSLGVPALIDANAVDPDSRVRRRYRLYNAAALFTAHGVQARYEKIHLVPFGEFMPYARLFSFASGLTQQVGLFDRGTRRRPLTDGAHRYGVFICYESIFPEEVRQLPLHGADVLVNLSDDGWYGDTSAPFQHSQMARVRAVENRRWLLRDTNNGITESIDPYGNIRAAAPRHQRLAIALPYAYTTQTTFYTRHGDVFAWLCAFITGAALLVSFATPKLTR